MRTAMMNLIGVLAASFTISACGRTVEWKQEVPLQDGRVIVVDRTSKQTGKLVPENTVIEYEKSISFLNPDSNEKIQWTLPEGTGPFLLDIDKGIPYLVLKASSVADYNTWGCPNPPWIVFRFERGVWSQIAIEELPARFVTTNILPAARTLPDFPRDGLVTVARMTEFMKRPGIDKSYRTISREKVNPIAEGCFDDVLVKQGRQSEIDYRR